MNCFENDGIDNHALVERMLCAIEDYVDAYLDLSEPVRAWFDQEYKSLHGPSNGVQAIHLSNATLRLAMVLGVVEPKEYQGIGQDSE